MSNNLNFYSYPILKITSNKAFIGGHVTSNFIWVRPYWW